MSRFSSKRPTKAGSPTWPCFRLANRHWRWRASARSSPSRLSSAGIGALHCAGEDDSLGIVLVGKGVDADPDLVATPAESDRPGAVRGLAAWKRIGVVEVRGGVDALQTDVGADLPERDVVFLAEALEVQDGDVERVSTVGRAGSRVEDLAARLALHLALGLSDLAEERGGLRGLVDLDRGLRRPGSDGENEEAHGGRAEDAEAGHARTLTRRSGNASR